MCVCVCRAQCLFVPAVKASSCLSSTDLFLSSSFLALLSPPSPTKTHFYSVEAFKPKLSNPQTCHLFVSVCLHECHRSEPELIRSRPAAIIITRFEGRKKKKITLSQMNLKASLCVWATSVGFVRRNKAHLLYTPSLRDNQMYSSGKKVIVWLSPCQSRRLLADICGRKRRMERKREITGGREENRGRNVEGK